MDIGKYFGGSLDLLVKNPVQLIVAGIVAVIVSAATLSILAAPMTAGLIAMFLAARKGETLETGRVFRYVNRTGSLFVAQIVLAVLIGIGLVLLVVPGLYLMARWCHVLPLMADRDLSLSEAMAKSAEITARDGVIMTLIFLAVCAVIAGAGSALAGFGMLFTYPLSVGAYALAYSDRRGI